MSQKEAHIIFTSTENMRLTSASFRTFHQLFERFQYSLKSDTNEENTYLEEENQTAVATRMCTTHTVDLCHRLHPVPLFEHKKVARTNIFLPPIFGAKLTILPRLTFRVFDIYQRCQMQARNCLNFHFTPLNAMRCFPLKW